MEVFRHGDEVIVVGNLILLGINKKDCIARIIGFKPTGILNCCIRFNDGNDVWVSGIQIKKYIEKEKNYMVDETAKCCGTSASETYGRGLYQVMAINPTEDGEIILDEKVIAQGRDDAKFSSSLKEELKNRKLKLGDVDVIVTFIGGVRPYETVQKVKVVGSVDGYKLVKEQK